MSLIGYLIIIFAVLAAIGGAVLRRGLLAVSDGWSFTGIWIGGFFLLATIVTLAIWVGSNIGYRYATDACDRFSAETGRVTKMYRFNTGSWDCLVQTDNGWVAKDRLYGRDGA